jgi:hypothetical protein
MACRVNPFVHSVLLVCEFGIFSITFVKLASDTRTARDAHDAAQIKKLRQHISLTILSSVLTLITFIFTFTSTYVMSRLSMHKSTSILGSMKSLANSLKGGRAKWSSTVAAERASTKAAQGAVDVGTLVR